MPTPRLLALPTASLLGLGLCTSALGQDPTTYRASVSTTGAEPTNNAFDVDTSGCGRFVVFASRSSELVEGDTNGEADVFLRDLATGETTRISVSTDGEEANDGCSDPVISADGRFVAFQSDADNLVEGDTNGEYDIFLHNVVTGVTTRVSVSSDGEEANNDSFGPAISADNRTIVWSSDASNLVHGDHNDRYDIFVHNRDTGITSRVSVDSHGNEANDDSSDPTVSGDGVFVAFESDADNLVAMDTNGERDVFVYNRHTGETVRVGVDSSGLEPNDFTDDAVISANGRYVSFESRATNLVPDDHNDEADIFRHDLHTGETIRVNLASDGSEANNASFDPAISANGRYMAFGSRADNLVEGDTNHRWDIFFRDIDEGVTFRVSVSSSGEQGDEAADDHAISENGRFVAFESSATNMVEGDTNHVQDIFTRGYLIGEPRLSRLGGFDLFAGHDTDVILSNIDGTLAGGWQVNLQNFSSAHRGDLTPNSDVILAGTKLKGASGAVMRGNAVYGGKNKLEQSVTFVNASTGPREEPCVRFDLHLLHEAAMELSTSLGMTPATGTTTEEFGNLVLQGEDPGLNVFLIEREQLEEARSIRLEVPHGAQNVINVEGGKVTASILGILLSGADPENVLFNFFEAHKIGLSIINLEAGVLSPFAKLTVQEISVFGNLVAKRLTVVNVKTFGRNFDLGSLLDPVEDEYLSGEDGSDTPGYTLTWTPNGEEQVLHLVHQSPEVMEVWTEGPGGTLSSAARQVRLDRLERLVFVGRSDLSKIKIDPEITLPVELTGLAPVAQDDHVALEWGGVATADVLANDLASPVGLDPTSVQVLTPARFGTVSVDPTTGAVTYDCAPLVEKPAGLQGEVLEYTVKDMNGVASTPRRVRFSFEDSESGELSQR